MNIAVFYFSATGNTKQIAEAIAGRLEESGDKADLIDITLPQNRQANTDLSKYDAMVLGSPIHSMRSPRLVRDWIATLDGGGMKCATFFTYGGFQVHPTHYDARQRLEKQGFKLVASAEFLGKHTFNIGGWQSMIGRPGQDDTEVARKYADALHARFSGQDQAMVGELDKGPYTEEQLDEFEGFRFKLVTQLPTRGGEECQMCMLCEEECPSGAMDAETGEADPNKCIACLHCVEVCPDEVLAINDISDFFKRKMDMDKETPETLAAKKSKMYL
jgi:flavodoxin/ferredoxin